MTSPHMVRPEWLDRRPEEKPVTFIIMPTPGRVVIKLQPMERSTKAGIVLLSENGEKPTTGYVERVCASYDVDGEGYEPLFEPGEAVLFGRYSGTRVKIGDDVFLVINERDILSRLVPSDSPEAKILESKVTRVSTEIHGVKVNPPAELAPGENELQGLD